MALQLGELSAEEKAAGLWKEAQEGELGIQLLGLPTSALTSCYVLLQDYALLTK